MSTPERSLGVAWVAEPEHWSALHAGAVVQQGAHLAVIAGVGAHEGRRWLKTWPGAGPDGDTHWAPDNDPDPLALVLRRRDVLVGEVITP